MIDTDVLIWFFRGNESAEVFLRKIPYGQRVTSSLCIMELVQGCLDRHELKTVKDFAKNNLSSVMHPDDKTCEKAMILLERHSLSDGLRTIDALLAATAITKGVTLATSNLKHFKNISGLHLQPFAP